MTLLVQETRGSVRLLRLNDPKRRNLLSMELCHALSAAVVDANSDPDVKAIVITGAAPAFCAGANLDDLKAATAGETKALHAVYQSFMDVANSALPTIAAVGGAAVGAGFNLALACDMRIAATDAQFDCRFLKIGLHPGGGHSWMLLRAIGWSAACRMLLLNKPVRAEEAKAIGLVQDVTTPETLLNQAIELAARTDMLPRELIMRSKAAMRMAASSDHQTAFVHEAEEQMRSLHQPPFQELVRRLEVEIGAR